MFLFGEFCVCLHSIKYINTKTQPNLKFLISNQNNQNCEASRHSLSFRSKPDKYRVCSGCSFQYSDKVSKSLFHFCEIKTSVILNSYCPPQRWAIFKIRPNKSLRAKGAFKPPTFLLHLSLYFSSYTRPSKLI